MTFCAVRALYALLRNQNFIVLIIYLLIFRNR